jgi:glycosyltransferase involved in cell wall biosynthesis
LNILVLHNRYQVRGGEDSVVDAEVALLQDRGHTVTLALKDNRDIRSARDAALTGVRTWHAPRAQAELQQLIRTHRPDVVHVHNWFPQWSPSVFGTCKAAGVPVVATLHNFRLACPAGTLYRGEKTCESCLPLDLAVPAVIHGCYRGSAIQSAIVAGATGLHRRMGTWQREVDAYILLTRFQRDKMAAWGLPLEKMHIKPNFYPGTPSPPAATKDTDVLFIGRLSEEKGLSTLIQGFRQIRGQATLTIAGDGPMKEEVSHACEASQGRMRYVGRLAPPEVSHWMARSRILAIPSTWYEGMPVTLLEAMAHSLPVAASRIGSLPELIDEGEQGWLLPPGDPQAWGRGLEAILSLAPEALGRHGVKARATYAAYYAPDSNYKSLMALYEHVIDESA